VGNCRDQDALDLMVRTQLEGRGIRHPAVLAAFRRVPRHEYVPAELRGEAYGDHPLPIGAHQTISQPYVVAYMLEHAELRATDRVLEIGTGSGYQTALLSELVDEVYSVEVVPELAARAEAVLERRGRGNTRLRLGDGTRGWPEHAPFDAIVGSAAPHEIPRPLLDQLGPGGRLIMPVGGMHQHLVLVKRTLDGILERRALLPVRFVPMVNPG
jgi:protein-L-isoaspartate(D-aspartate) O-methyltransferase